MVRPPIRYPDDEGDGSLRIDVLTQFPGLQFVTSLVDILVSDSRQRTHPLVATRDINPALINSRKSQASTVLIVNCAKPESIQVCSRPRFDVDSARTCLRVITCERHL